MNLKKKIAWIVLAIVLFDSMSNHTINLGGVLASLLSINVPLVVVAFVAAFLVLRQRAIAANAKEETASSTTEETK